MPSPRGPKEDMPVPRGADFAGPSSESVAWDEPIVRTAWRAHARRARDLTLAGIAVVAVMTAIFIVVDQKDDARLRRSVETNATVTGGGYTSRYSSDHVDVTYVVNGVVHDGRLKGEVPDDYPEGSTITIAYDPADPTSFRTRSNANHSRLLDAVLTIALCLAVLVLLTGLLTVRASRRWRRWFRSRALLTVNVVEGSLPRLFAGDAWLLRISSPHHPDVAARLTGMQRGFDGGPTLFGAAPSGFDGQAVVCAGAGRRLVVIDPNVEIPVEVTLPRNSRISTKWLNRF